jgi:hypothetical protein
LATWAWSASATVCVSTSALWTSSRLFFDHTSISHCCASLEDNGIGSAGIISLASGFAFNNDLLSLKSVCVHFSPLLTGLACRTTKPRMRADLRLAMRFRRTVLFKSYCEPLCSLPSAVAHVCLAWTTTKSATLGLLQSSRVSRGTWPCLSFRLSAMCRRASDNRQTAREPVERPGSGGDWRGSQGQFVSASAQVCSLWHVVR